MLVEAVGEAEDQAGGTEPISVGRARRHAPEVDGLVFIPGEHKVGSLINVEIADAAPYDLWAHDPHDAPGVPAARTRPSPRARSRAVTRREKRGRGRTVPMARPRGT
ncbi:MAG: hypothetical protein ACR2LS_10065 [Thermomicrobiales bacterium]